MFDIETLRLTLASVSLCVLVLFYAGVYRPTRSSFAGWWTLALLCSFLSPILLLANHTPLQVIANPLSSMISGLGSVLIWFATRALRERSNHGELALVTVIVLGAAAAVQSPGTNIWAGNGTLYFAMAVFFVLAAREMWLARAERAEVNEDFDGEARVALLVSALASSVLALFYVARFSLFAAAGPESDVFDLIVGRGVTVIILLITLVAVTFSVSALGYDQQTRALRRRVSLDDLTGLLSRSAFFDRSSHVVRETDRRALLVVADLDHFKSINDTFGHAAGDRALELFAASVKHKLEHGELAGRLGGEEFALLLFDESLERTVSRLGSIGVDYEDRGSREHVNVPTVSFGIAPVSSTVLVERSLARADVAMYRAKSAGRNRVMLDPELI